MINTNLITLISLILVGLLILIFGFIIQKKILQKKKLEEIKMYSNYNNENISKRESEAKNYILKYKDSYSEDSIKNILINNGNSLNDVEEWLNKYIK